MYDYVTDNVLNAIYSPNDRLGVELMGAINWNTLKQRVAANTVNTLNKVNGGNRSKFLQKVVNASKSVRNNPGNIKGYRSISRAIKGIKYGTLNDPLCAELLGVNEEYAAELLGYSVSDLWRQTKKITHKVLEAGENIPVADAAVSRFRDITNIFKTGSSAADTAQTVYDNRGKIIIIGGLGAFGLYLLLRKKK